MATTISTDDRSVLLDICPGGVVHRECDDRPVGGVSLEAFAPAGRADDDFRTVEVTFPVEVRDEYEPPTWEYPGWRSHEVAIDRSHPTLVTCDGVASCLLPSLAQELFEALGLEFSNDL